MRWTAALVAMLALAAPASGEPFGPPAPASKEPSAAERMIALYKDEYAHRAFKPCPPSRPGEVTVCGTGRGGSADRLPLPEERGPPDGPRPKIGDLPAPGDALAVASAPCDGIGCGGKGGLNLLAAPFVVVRAIHGLIDPEWASDRTDAGHPPPGR